MNRVRAELGFYGEEQVVAYLQRHGYLILARNVRWRGGEIDIVARKAQLIACVEVKTRRVRHFPLSGVVTPSKQQKIIRTARNFLAYQRLAHDYAIRFDIALVELVEQEWKITYITNAFTAPED